MHRVFVDGLPHDPFVPSPVEPVCSVTGASQAEEHAFDVLSTGIGVGEKERGGRERERVGERAERLVS